MQEVCRLYNYVVNTRKYEHRNYIKLQKVTPTYKENKMCNCNKVWQVGWSKRRERIVESARSLQIVQLHANVNTEITENYKKVTTNYKKKEIYSGMPNE